MAVFLKILAVIGIVLLSLIGAVLLVLLLVLFVPVRYKASGSYKDNKPSFCAGASWLLHVVSVKYTLGEEEPLTVKILGFKIKKKEEKLPDFDEETEDFEDLTPSEASPKDTSENPSPEPSKTPAEDTTEEVMVSHESQETPESYEDSAPDTTTDATSDSTEEIHDSFDFQTEPSEDDDKKRKKRASKSDANKNFDKPNFYDKIKKYIEIIESRRFKKAFEYSKTKIIKVLKHICPRKIEIFGELGFDDPSLTGKIISYTSMLIPIFGKNVRIVGNFTEPVIHIEGKLKGHITLIRVLWTGAALYFNKNIRKIIKMFREV